MSNTRTGSNSTNHADTADDPGLRRVDVLLKLIRQDLHGNPRRQAHFRKRVAESAATERARNATKKTSKRRTKNDDEKPCAPMPSADASVTRRRSSSSAS